jgi:hypothetical protein
MGLSGGVNEYRGQSYAIGGDPNAITIAKYQYFVLSFPGLHICLLEVCSHLMAASSNTTTLTSSALPSASTCSVQSPFSHHY